MRYKIDRTLNIQTVSFPKKVAKLVNATRRNITLTLIQVLRHSGLLPPRFGTYLYDFFDLKRKELNSIAEERFPFLKHLGRGNRYIYGINFGDRRLWFCGMELPRNRINLTTRHRTGQICTSEHFTKKKWNIPS